MRKRKTNKRTSWAAPYSQQKELRDINLLSNYLRELIDLEINKSFAREEDSKRFFEDPDGYLLAKENDRKAQLRRETAEAYAQLAGQNPLLAGAMLQGNTGMAGGGSGTGSIISALTATVLAGAIRDWSKDFFNKYGKELNSFQIGEFQGYMDRAKLFNRLMLSVNRSYDIQLQIEHLENQIKFLKNSNDPQSTNEIFKKQQLIKELSTEYQSLLLHRDAFDSYIPNKLTASIIGLIGGNGENSLLSNNRLFGRSSQAHDELLEITSILSGINNPGMTINNKKELLSRANEMYELKMKEWRRGIKYNQLDKDSYEAPSKWFEERASKAGTDFLDPNTYLFAMPGLLAGTASGMTKTIPSMLLGTATAAAVAAATVATGGTAALLGGAALAGTAGTFALNYGAGVGENNMEVALAYSEKLEDYLKSQKSPKSKKKTLYDELVEEGRKKIKFKPGSTDEDVFNAFRYGDFNTSDVNIQKKMREFAIGIESLFQDDMAAVTWTSGAETIWQVAPIGRAMGMFKPLRTMLTRLEKSNRIAGSILRSQILKEMGEGFDRGSTIGLLPAIANSVIHPILSPTLKTAGKFGMNVANKMGITAAVSKFIPKVAFKTAAKNSVRGKYLRGIAGTWVKSSIAEGIEEGKQHAAAERYKRGEYDSPIIKDVWDTLLDDAIAGSKSAYLIAGMPFEGLMSEADRRMLQEIKGGMLLGGLQTTIVKAAGSIAPYRTEMSATDAILNTVLTDKLGKIDLFNKAKVYAEKSKSGGSYNAVKEAFDRLRNLNERRKSADGEYDILPKHIDDEQKQFERISKMANDAYTIKLANALGIEEGSKQYNEFVAAKALAVLQLEDQKQIVREARKQYGNELHEQSNKRLSQRLQEVSSMIPGSEQQGNDLELQDSGPVNIERGADEFMQLQTVAQYAALLRRKQEIEAGIQNAQVGNHTEIEKILKKLLSNVNDHIKLVLSAIKSYISKDQHINLESLEDIERELVKNKQDHDILSKLYRDVLISEDDMQLAENEYELVVGKAYKDGKEIVDFGKIDADKDFDSISFKGGNAKQVIKKIYDTINDDNDFASAIQEDFESRTDDEGNEIISPEEKLSVEDSILPEGDSEQEFKNEVKQASKKPYVTPSMEVREKPVQPVLEPSETVSSPQPTVIPETSQEFSEQLKNNNEDPYENLVAAARNGDVGAQEEMMALGLDWEKKPVVRFVAQGEVDFILNGGRYNGRFNDGRVDVTNSNTPTTAASAEYRITFKDTPELDWALSSKRLMMKNKDHGDGLLKGGYSLDDVATIERRNEDGSYTVIYDASNSVQTSEQTRIVQELKARAEASKKNVVNVDIESYTIKVGDQVLKMPRVHSVMPKYWHREGSYKAALQLGNAFDNLARIFFGDPENIRRFEQNPNALIDELFNTIASEDPENPNALNKTYKDLYVSKDAFADTVKDLYNLAKEYQKLGWVLFTDKIVWYSKFNRGWVAGETDMIAVDRDGNIHIIDFKTAKGLHPFLTYTNDDVYRTNKYKNLLSQLTEEDFSSGPRRKSLSKKARAIKRQIRDAEGGDKNIMITWNGSEAVLTYANNDYNTNHSNYRTGPKAKEYSEQLTAYAEMIQSQLANVVDLEVVGFRTTYATDEDTNLTKIDWLENEVNGKPFRIKVPFSDEMRSILNNEGAPLDPIDLPRKEATDAQEQIENVETVQNQQIANTVAHTPQKSEDSLAKPGEVSIPTGNIGYSNLNAKMIENDPELAKLTADPDFVNKCLEHGLIELYTEEVQERNGTHGYVYANITYNGKEYKRIYVWSAKDSPNQLDQDTNLYKKIKALEQNKKPGQKIVATNIRRTAGQIKFGKDVPVNHTDLIAGTRLEDLEFSIESGKFGFVKDGDVVSFVGGSITQQSAMYSYKGRNIPAPKNGTIIFVKNPNHKESPNEAVPVAIKRKTAKDSVDFIILCLLEIDTIDNPHYVSIGGLDVSVGATRRELLSLLIPYVNDPLQVGSYAIIRDNQYPSVFHLITRTSDQPIASVNILDQTSVNEFKKVLGTVDLPMQNSTLVARIGESTEKTPSVFRKIKAAFAKNKDFDSITITPDLRFDRSDILGKGLTGFGWYVKTGRLITNYDSIIAPLVSVGDVGIFDSSAQVSVTEVKDAIDNIQEVTDDDVIDLSGLFKRRSNEDQNKARLTEKEIKENLRPILGDEVDDPEVLQVISHIATDPEFKDAAVVGVAHKDGIRIYGDAFAGVEYHEAFHRIFELFVSPQLRDKIYQQVAKANKINLETSDESNNFIGHRLVAEIVADKFMDYKAGEFKTRFNTLNRILNFIRGVAKILSHWNNRQLYKLFMEVNSGKYRSERRIEKDSSQKDRFDKMFNNLNYEIHGLEFKHILNDVMYEDVKNTAFYCITLGLNIDLSGATIQDVKINRSAFMKGADRLKEKGFDIFGTEIEPDQKSVGLLAMSEAYSNFDSISDDIAAMMSAVATDYKKIRRQEAEDDRDGDEESIASSYDENFFKWDYEFDRFDKTSSRVKYFFANIPDMVYDERGNFVPQVNQLGMPQLLPMKYVFNEVLSHLYDVDTIQEALERLLSLAKSDPMFAIIHKNLQDIVNTREVNGKVDVNKEALLAQIMNTIRSNRNTFMIAKAEKNNQGLYTVHMLTSDAEYNAREFPMLWGLVLAKGGSEILKINEYGQLVFNPKNPEAASAFKKIARLFDFNQKINGVTYVGLKQMLSDINAKDGRVLVLPDVVGTAGYEFLEYSDAEMINAPRKSTHVYRPVGVKDLNNPKQLKLVKDKIVEALNAIGINIHEREFDYMLRSKYGSTDADALRQMVSSTDLSDSMTTFLQFLNTISNGKTLNIQNDGTVFVDGEAVKFEDVYTKLAFVKNLGSWKYQYRHSHDELSVLAIGNNRFYEMSDNDLFSDTIRALNKRTLWYEDLKADPYNYCTEDNANGEQEIYGSIVLKRLSIDPDAKVKLCYYTGFKTDKRGDVGQDYFEISRREDYLSKIQMLEAGGIISLTLSDKKKYVYISGIKLPGLDYTGILSTEGNEIPNVSLASQKTHNPQDSGIDQLDSVVTQFLSYAKAEYQSILSAGSKETNVANYKENGKRFSSLLGVWEDVYDKDGKFKGEEFISFNDGNKTWEENLRTAEEYFFNRSEDEQKALIKRNLNKITDKELETTKSLGLIEKIGDNENPYFNYKNVGLNEAAISAIKNAYLLKYPGVISDQVAESIAVVVYLNDMSNKAIMSGQEMERLMSGSPAFYKWKYNENGELIDRTTDELKRLGGLGSTGTNNFLELSDIPEKYKKDGVFTGKYRCAEVDNEEVASPQIEVISKMMYEGKLRENIIYDKLSKETTSLIEERDRLIAQLKSNKTFASTFRTILDDIRTDKNLSEAQKSELIDNLENSASVFDDIAPIIQHVNDVYLGRLQAVRERIADEVDNQSIDELEEAYKDSELVSLSKDQATSASKSYSKGIDVADGGAYISDEMCEMLLRMEGAYSEDIKEAFDILRGRKKTDYLGLAEAYGKVLTKVIGSQKYTAFGRRLQNGTSVPYYHKMALFPIFDCIATGKMGNIFDKMKEQGIDMLLVNSAVKVGSLGSKPITWSNFREDSNPENANNFAEDSENGLSWKPTFNEAFNFDTYDVDFAYLRKQLNTDPKDEEMLRMGTLAQKIIFSNLLKERLYKTQDGESIRGQELLNTIMNSLNKLSDIGVAKINKRFFVTDKDGNPLDINGDVLEDQNSKDRVLDVQKFAKEVSRMMSDRGADKNVLRALEVVSNQSGDHLSIPLGAISNSSWLESILISAINKEVVDVNTPGAFFILRSVWGMQGQKIYDSKKGQIIGRQLYNGKRLEMINEEGSMDCVLSLDYFQHILPQVLSDEYELDEDGNYIYQKDSNGKYKEDKYGNPIPKRKMRNMSFNEARQWLIDNGVIGGKSNIVAYRIPTQAESSIHALRCVDVLPVVRDTVILPEEFTKITGSDFD